MQSQPIGFLPKNTAIPTGWSSLRQVTEICSVSCHVNSTPDGCFERWVHNRLGFFSTLADARAAIATHPESFVVFAYRLLMVRFAAGRQEALLPDDSLAESIPCSFVSRGFDVVSRSVTSFFECSPLSCNGMADEVPVNSGCLVETVEEAIALAERFSLEQPEPGPYYVVEVLREPAQAASPAV